MNPFLAMMIGHIPLELVSVGGLVALCYRWSTMERASAVMVLVALIANQLLFVLNLFFAHWTQSQIELGSPTVAELARLRLLFSFPQVLVSATAWALLLVAAFAARGSPSKAAG